MPTNLVMTRVPSPPRASRIGVFLLLPMIAGLLLAWKPAMAVAVENLSVTPFLTWKLIDGETAKLSFAGKQYSFSPQSFFFADGAVTISNRFDPLLVRYAKGGTTPERVTPLKHPEDRKFDARFFSDLVADHDRTFLLEQSTATIRRAGKDGTIEATWLLTGGEGAVITRFWPAGKDSFWLYDEGRKLLLLRRCDKAPDPNQDAPGAEYPLSADSLSAGGGRLLIADKEGEADWGLVALAAAAPNVSPTVIATQTASEFRVLDVDEAGTAYVYVRDQAGSAILRVPPQGDPKRFSLVAPLSFPEDRGRVAQAVDSHRLIVLVMGKTDEIALAEIKIP